LDVKLPRKGIDVGTDYVILPIPKCAIFLNTDRNGMEGRDLNEKKPDGTDKGKDARAVQDGSVALTSRESEVLAWVGEGKRDAEIALVLGVSVRTVNKHVQSILAKLHVETRTAAARYAVRISPKDDADNPKNEGQ
jgi:DNA-binding CsgD family transcriptional regulator